VSYLTLEGKSEISRPGCTTCQFCALTLYGRSRTLKQHLAGRHAGRHAWRHRSRHVEAEMLSAMTEHALTSVLPSPPQIPNSSRCSFHYATPTSSAPCPSRSLSLRHRPQRPLGGLIPPELQPGPAPLASVLHSPILPLSILIPMSPDRRMPLSQACRATPRTWKWI
jgi:hypothetical protein